MKWNDRDNAIEQKTIAFALRIIKAYKFLMAQGLYTLPKQMLRSGTAIGALVQEAQYAESSSDFIHKLRIALKEANETEYWIYLFYKDGDFKENLYSSLSSDCVEIKKLLVSIINKSIENGKNQK